MTISTKLQVDKISKAKRRKARENVLLLIAAKICLLISLATFAAGIYLTIQGM